MILNKIRGKDALKNIGQIYSAQIVSLAFSLVMSLYVPKILGVEEFSYWQLFLFYASYVGILQFGLNDGIYLRYGGKDLNLNEEKQISNQLYVMILYFVLLSGIFVSIISYVSNGQNPKITILFFVVIYAIIYNVFGFCGSVLQATNNFKLYSINIITEKTIMTVAIIILSIIQIKDFEIIVVSYMIATLFIDIIILLRAKNLFLSSFSLNKGVLREIAINISVGINLMFSNIASALIVGICRFVVSENYPINIFGFVSFALSLCGFCLIFISQIGNAIYPILKRKSNDYHKVLFQKTDYILSNTIPLTFLAYPILCLVVKKYLPNYNNSLIYFGALLPLCIFEAKISILYGTFMKVIRLERNILYINIIVMLFSALFSIIGIIILDNITLSLIGISICVMVKAVLMRHQVVKFWGYSKELKLAPSDIIITLVYFSMIMLGIQAAICSWGIVVISAINLFARRVSLIKNLRFFLRSDERIIQSQPKKSL